MTGVTAGARRLELERLARAHDDTVTPAQLVAYATDPRTALHTLFTWDDRVAGPKYRELEAAQYLRAVVTLLHVEGHEPKSVRAFVSLSSDRDGTHVYRPITAVLQDHTQRALLVDDVRRELLAMKRKYGHLQELATVWAQVEEHAGATE